MVKMGRWYDDDACKSCHHERKYRDVYDDIKSFINKVQVLENKLDFVSEIFPKFERPRIKNIEGYNPKDETNVLIDKVRQLENKIGHFLKVLNAENYAHNDDRVQTISDRAFKNLLDNFRALEEKLRELSKIKMLVNVDRSGESKNGTAQIKEKLHRMKQKIEQFNEVIPSNRVANLVDAARAKPADIIEQMQELAEKMQLYSRIASTSPRNMPAAETSIKRAKSFLPKPIFSGRITPRRKPSAKKGFITWPSDDNLSDTSNDRQCYIMRCGESQADIKPKNLTSEPSEFYCDFSHSPINGLSIKETQACGSSKIKNSELK